MSPKIYLIILKIGVYLSFLSVFFVFKHLLFPFISSKQIYFNILIEILFVFWLVFLIKYPSCRPKKSWISIGLIVFFAAIFISAIFGVDFNLSFWGDVERMLGVFQLLHFLAFFFIIITVFRERRDWQILFGISVATAVFIACHSLFVTAYATIGNSAYVGAYLIFNIYFALFLFHWIKNPLVRVLLLAAAALMAVGIWKIRVAGAYAGLGVSLLALLFFFGLASKSKKIKTTALALLVAVVLLAALLFFNKESGFVQGNSFLRVAADELSFKKNTFQTRLLSWKAAWKDFPSHPFLGTGYGNYAVTFDKYFEPIFYTYTPSETYFDRAHNNLVDIASTSGLAGLLTYLSIFAAAFFYLIRGWRRKEIEPVQFALATCLIAAYFIQNLAVFDALVSYLALMVTLGYVYWLSEQERSLAPLKGAKLLSEKSLNNKEIFTFVAAGLVMLFVIYQYNVKPLKMLVGTIQGQMVFAGGDLAGSIKEYKKALSYETPLDRDSRSTLIQLFASSAANLSKMDRTEAGEAFDYVISLAERNVQYNEADSLTQMQLAQILNAAASFHSDDSEKFSNYSGRAMEAVDKSIAASPGRVPIYFVKAQIYLTRGDKVKAVQTMEYAIGLNENYFDGYCQLGKIYFFYQEEEKALAAMGKCLDFGGAGSLTSANLVKQLINFYIGKKDLPKIINLYERLTQLEGEKAEIWANLAKLYAEEGRIEEAKTAALKAAELNPSLKEDAEKFIQGLR